MPSNESLMSLKQKLDEAKDEYITIKEVYRGYIKASSAGLAFGIGSVFAGIVSLIKYGDFSDFTQGMAVGGFSGSAGGYFLGLKVRANLKKKEREISKLQYTIDGYSEIESASSKARSNVTA